MPAKAADLVAGLDIPEPNRLVPAAGQDITSVRRIGDRVNLCRVPFKAAQLLAAGTPQPQRFVGAAGQGAPAIRGKSNAAHIIAMALKAAQLLAAGGGPQVDRLVHAAGKSETT